MFTVGINGSQVQTRAIDPDIALSSSSLTVIVAVFGATISPYLFFWQSSEEVEELELNHEPDLRHEAATRAEAELSRIRWDPVIGMAFSNLVAFFIILTRAVALLAHGVTEIQISAQAAEALKPIAGPLAFACSASASSAQGLLATPVLAGSAACAVSEWRGWKRGLEHWPWEARGFYAVIAAAMILALAVVFSPLDLIKTLSGAPSSTAPSRSRSWAR